MTAAWIADDRGLGHLVTGKLARCGAPAPDERYAHPLLDLCASCFVADGGTYQPDEPTGPPVSIASVALTYNDRPPAISRRQLAMDTGAGPTPARHPVDVDMDSLDDVDTQDLAIALLGRCREMAEALGPRHESWGGELPHAIWHGLDAALITFIAMYELDEHELAEPVH